MLLWLWRICTWACAGIADFSLQFDHGIAATAATESAAAAQATRAALDWLHAVCTSACAVIVGLSFQLGCAAAATIAATTEAAAEAAAEAK